MSSLRFRKPSDNVEGIIKPEPSSVPKIHTRRLRLAGTVIYFTKVLESLSKKVLSTNNIGILRSLSYVAINVPPETVEETNILDAMVREQDLESLTRLGGVPRVAAVLETDIDNGLSDEETDLVRRRDTFGENRFVRPSAKPFVGFVLEAFKDVTILILMACSVLSLGFGIKQHGVSEGWYDGGSIIIAIFLVVAVSAVSNYKQSRQFRRLSGESADIKVEVVRERRRRKVSIFEVVVGDIVCLKIGDQVPADGLFVYGYSLKVDESSMTGESNQVEIDSDRNPFLLSGTKVADGYGRMVVVSVGMNTGWGQMMSLVTRGSSEGTPLQSRLNRLTSAIGKVGLAVAAVVLAVMFLRYFTGNTRDEDGAVEFRGGKTSSNDVMNAVIRIVAAAVTIVVVAIPEGLPLAVTLTLAFSMKRMMKDHAMVRKLSACETMGSATTICIDKTGTLTMNEMHVTEVYIGEDRKNPKNIDVSPDVHNLLVQGIGANTTGTIYKPTPESALEVSGSPTEKAILTWGASNLGMKAEEYEILHVEAFNSEKKRSGVLIKKLGDRTGHVHWKGAAEMILSNCSSYYGPTGSVHAIDDRYRARFGSIVQDMAEKSLRCISFAHKEASSDDCLRAKETLEKDNDLTLLGIIGLKDPCRPGVRAAVESCKAAGVSLKMITGDNVHTARAIAIECGILDPIEDSEGDSVVEGFKFRNFSPEERSEKIEKIRVMARSSPFDKLLMVESLKQKGHVVAVTGDGTNDAPALKEADIGLAMGIQGTEVAKESSDIVILDDNFASVVTVLRWGRCVYTNIQKFIQFQLTVNIAALVINFVAAVSSGEVPLTAVQLLWVNLIMDTLGALALATEPPTNELMAKPPVGRSEPLITTIMWRNLAAQAIYQVTILLVLQFKGGSIFGVEDRVKNTIIFNCFVLCQVFNEFNARKLEKKNVFEGILKNKLFIGIVGGTVVLQVVMVEFLKKFASTERLEWGQWGACVAIAALSWPIGWLVKCVPESSIEGFLSRVKKNLGTQARS